MSDIVTFKDVDRVLASFVPPMRDFRAAYTLDNMRAIMAALGNPQDSYKVIHVAGTSGKTSTCYYIASLLMQAGQTVGLTVSPHVDQVNERVQINLQLLSESDYCQQFANFMTLLETVDIKPTYFELLVAFAYWQFAQAKVDYAVVEVGLGGLLDGTNVVNRPDKISVLTDIGLDHVDILGNSLAEIAAQKAGIILPNSDIFCFEQTPEVDQVFVDQAYHKQARLHTIKYQPSQLATNLPLFQQRNWSLAKVVVSFVLERDGYKSLTIHQLTTSTNTQVPARMEVINRNGKTLVLDAAHNPQKMQALVPSLKANFPDQKFAVLMALLRSKDMRLSGVLKELLPITSHLIVTDFVAGQDLRKRSTPPQTIIEACHSMGFDSVEIISDTRQAYQALMNRPEQYRLVTGSFYLLHDMHKLIGPLK